MRIYNVERRILVTGGAGFLGSHLCERLLAAGHQVLCVDNFFTGTKRNIEHLLEHPGFELMRHDVTFPLYVEVDQIYNLACPASPVHYQHDPVAIGEAKRVLPGDLQQRPELVEHLRFADSPMQAVEGADALVVMTDWKAFKSPIFAALKQALKQPVIFDGRNLYGPEIRNQGFEYMAVGR